MVPSPSLHPPFLLIKVNLLRLLWSGGATKNIEGDIKPAVNVSMDDMVLVTDLLGGETLLHSLGLCGCTVLICPTQIEGVPLAEAGVPGREYDDQPLPRSLGPTQPPPLGHPILWDPQLPRVFPAAVSSTWQRRQH